jgi:hypothetical protein
LVNVLDCKSFNIGSSPVLAFILSIFSSVG